MSGNREMGSTRSAMRPASRMNAEMTKAKMGRLMKKLGAMSQCPAEAVWGAAGTGSQAFVRERSGDVALAGAHSGLGQGPVDDVALRVAAADLPCIETNRQHQLYRLGPCAAVARREALDHRNADCAVEARCFDAVGRRRPHRPEPLLDQRFLA